MDKNIKEKKVVCGIYKKRSLGIVELVMILWFVLVPTLWNHIANLHALYGSLVLGGTNTMIGWPLRFNSHPSFPCLLAIYLAS
jgi:hypothetical protein